VSRHWSSPYDLLLATCYYLLLLTTTYYPPLVITLDISLRLTTYYLLLLTTYYLLLTLGHHTGHVRRSIADVDLTDRDRKGAAVERAALGQTWLG